MQRYRVVILLVVVGVIPVVIAFFAVLSYLQDPGEAPETAAPAEVKPPPPPPRPKSRPVLAAARALPAGTLIGEDDLTELALDQDALHKGHLVVGKGAKASALRGYAVREALDSGEPFTWSVIVGPDEQGFLATVLEPGMRAVTIRVGPATKHAGLIDPGDRVDVILTGELEIVEGERRTLARTIVEDARVVAVDRRLGTRVAPPANDRESDEGGRQVPRRTEMTTATLEVPPEQGERLVLGEYEGRLSLAVRSLAAAAVPRASLASVRLDELLFPPEGEPPSDWIEPPKTVRIFRGSESPAEVSFDDAAPVSGDDRMRGRAASPNDALRVQEEPDPSTTPSLR